mgnify:CR=1 FL=1
MKKPENLKVGDMFRVIEEEGVFESGEIITLKKDDGTDCPLFWNAHKSDWHWPFFWNADKSNWHYISFSQLEPYAKTMREAQVGDIVIRGRKEHMVLERGQNTVMLSRVADFEVAGISYHFHELEKNFTLKNAPDVKSAKTAEAMKVLKEAGYTITKD